MEQQSQSRQRQRRFNFFRSRSSHYYCDREIRVGESLKNFPKNRITTSRYNILNFIPKNLLLQFSKPANIYFLLLGLLQLIPQISNTGGVPTTFLPLSFVILVSSIKEIVEDLRKHKFDREENNKQTLIFKNGDFRAVKWESLRVGDIVRVNENQYFPADMLILYSSGRKGTCYIETKNLDGETNLKIKQAHKNVMADFDTSEKLAAARNIFKYEKSNDYLYKFTGSIETTSGETSQEEQNFVLRGSSLRNTDYMVGVVAYTGHQNKIMLNAIKSKVKFSRLEKTMSTNFVWIFLTLSLLCLFASIYSIIWYQSNRTDLDYLRLEGFSIKGDVETFFTLIGTWVLLLSRVVPISILVTLEMCRLFQSMWISRDKNMISPMTPGIGVSVQSPNLCEELGQVEYVLSDKTGTLTKNIMDFKAISIKGKSYGDQLGLEIMDNLPKVSNVDFWDKHLLDDFQNPGCSMNESVIECLILLAVCHSVVSEQKNGEIVYNAASPDELALVNFAKFIGVEFLDIDEHNMMRVRCKNSILNFELLHILEFNSARKRMSVIVRDDKGQIILYTKGADTVLLERVAMHEENERAHREITKLIESTETHLLEFANKGLRTLVLGKRILNPNMYVDWNKKYEEARIRLYKREEFMEDLQDRIEQNLELIGATAIEDKLQDDVALTIQRLREAGMKVWVLTGDKVETAVNIGFACGLLDNSMTHLKVTEHTEKEVADSIGDKLALIQQSDLSVVKYSLVVSGDALINALKPELCLKFMQLAESCNAVIACRVCPKQKHNIAALIRKVKPESTVLAIGDGANDVYMLSTANVSVGIRGLEGQQAAKASDFAIGEFKLLQRLLFYHGRENYRKNAYTILYSFYKNAVSIMVFFWFGFYSGFSGTFVYEDYMFQAYNVLFSSIPIVIFAIFDKEYSSHYLSNNPSLYIQGMKNKLFNKTEFCKWFSLGAFEAVIMTVVSFELFGSDSGRTADYLGPGMMIYFCTVLLVNLRIFVFSSFYSVLSVLSVLGMIVSFIAMFYGLSTVDNLPIRGYFSFFFENPVFWTVSLVQVLGLHLIAVMLHRYKMLSENEKVQRGLIKIRNEEVVPNQGKSNIKVELKRLTKNTISLDDVTKDMDSIPDSQELEISIEKHIDEKDLHKSYKGYAFSGPEMDESLRNAQSCYVEK